MSEAQAEILAPANPRANRVLVSLSGALVLALYWNALRSMYNDWTLADSYYSHGFLIAPISLYLVWTKRGELARAPRRPSPAGYPLVAIGASLLLLGDFLGFSIFQQISILPMLAGLSLLFFGKPVTRIVWFPLLFLLMMIPIPTSLTQSVALNLKLFAAESAVVLANALTLPMIREGSFIYFKDDFLLIGNVCGGLRSLIALFSIGMLMAYLSKARLWAQILTLAMSVPIAIAANVFRILFLCVTGYFFGSEAVTGTFHDVSGVLIFGVAFALFFSLEAILRKIAPLERRKETVGP